MRDADETIKTLLEGFRDAEPPSGMQSRILQAVELHPAVSPGLLESWGLRPSVAVGLVCAAVFTACLAVATRIYQPWHRPANVARQVTHAVAQQGARPKTTAVKAIAGLRRKAPRASATRPREETQMASYPAPALPLTEQERLLLRLAHRHDVQSVAILNPDLQTAASAEAAKQFQQFFGIDAKEMRNESE
jgi:hypothetical protein